MANADNFADALDGANPLEDPSQVNAIGHRHLQRNVGELWVFVLGADFLEDDQTSEVLFRSYSFSLDDFSAVNPAFDASQLTKICFVFDESPKGSIVIDNVALVPAP